MIFLCFSCLFLFLWSKCISNVNTYTLTYSVCSLTHCISSPRYLGSTGNNEDKKSMKISMKYPSTALVSHRLLISQPLPGCDHFLSFRSVPGCPGWRPNLPPSVFLFLIVFQFWHENPWLVSWDRLLRWCTSFVF